MIVKKGVCSPHLGCPCHVSACNTCPDFTGSGCGVHDHKPWGCRAYPYNPMALEDGYTYYFVEDGKRIDASNFRSFPDEDKRRWLDLTLDKSMDE